MERQRKYNEERVIKMHEIIEAIDHWLKNCTNGQIDLKVGALIQRHAMRELAFIEFISDEWKTIDELRILANNELQRLGNPFVPKPIQGVFYDFSIPFPTIDVTPVKTRKEELEEMTHSQIRDLYRKAKTKERKKERIKYILESEKTYK